MTAEKGLLEQPENSRNLLISGTRRRKTEKEEEELLDITQVNSLNLRIVMKSPQKGKIPVEFGEFYV